MHIGVCYGRVMSFKSNLVTGSSDAVRYPRMGMEIFSGPSSSKMTRVKFRACTRSPKQGMEMQLPTSFVGRLICHLTKLHVVSKCHIMVNFQAMEELQMLITIG